MLKDAEGLASGAAVEADLAVIGAGAAGIVLALELAKSGLSVTLVESGGPQYSERVQALAETPHLDPKVHPPMSECTRRQVGGTSVIWGGRVVPFDPVDFDDRAHMPGAKWPLRSEEVSSFHGRACAYLHAGKPEFSAGSLPGVTQSTIVPGLPDGDVLTSTLERWSVMNFGTVYADELKRSEKITLVHGLTCTEIMAEKVGSGSRVTGIRAMTLSGKAITLRAKRYVLACGGLNTTRLLLASDRVHEGGIGNHSGLLGRFYTGHITGRIAEVQFSTPPGATVFGFDRDEIGVYARRRFSFSRECQHREKLANIVSWLVNPEISDPAHGNGVLSFAYLALTSPMGKFFASEAIRKAAIKGAVRGSTMSHVMNMLRDLPRTAVFIPTFGYKRFLAKRKVPGFFQYSRSNTYTLHYACEQTPNPASRVTLAPDTDELGMRRIRIDHLYTDRDVQNVIRAHELWDAHLRKSGCGQLRYVESDIPGSIREQAGDGFHQIGTTRMAERPEDGVVDVNGKVHGFDDLYIASSSTFVTASQANSMFMILVMALRVADHLARCAKGVAA